MSKINGLPGGELTNGELERLTKAIQRDFKAMLQKSKEAKDKKETIKNENKCM